MEFQYVQLVAGIGSSLIFVISSLPMLYKAFRTKNMSSYSLMQIGLANSGNLLHWLYVVGLPFGPIWFLHGFNTVVALLMLFCYLWYELDFSQRVLSEHLLLLKENGRSAITNHAEALQP